MNAVSELSSVSRHTTLLFSTPILAEREDTASLLAESINFIEFNLGVTGEQGCTQT